ncbi:Uncharacterised protein [Mycobacteroides abscessus subsp. abscessus]|nr:Uncharacterised protein [Mycobacteroides abscessus subsp. abscessus]
MALLADHVGLVGLHPMLGVAVFVGEHSDGGGTELVGRAERAHRDLSAIGHKDFREHLCFSLLYRSPQGDASTGCRETTLLSDLCH